MYRYLKNLLKNSNSICTFQPMDFNHLDFNCNSVFSQRCIRTFTLSNRSDYYGASHTKPPIQFGSLTVLLHSKQTVAKSTNDNAPASTNKKRSICFYLWRKNTGNVRQLTAVLFLANCAAHSHSPAWKHSWALRYLPHNKPDFSWGWAWVGSCACATYDKPHYCLASRQA